MIPKSYFLTLLFWILIIILNESKLSHNKGASCLCLSHSRRIIMKMHPGATITMCRGSLYPLFFFPFLLLQSCRSHGSSVKGSTVAPGTSTVAPPILSRAPSQGKRFRWRPLISCLISSTLSRHERQPREKCNHPAIRWEISTSENHKQIICKIVRKIDGDYNLGPLC